MTWLYKDRNKNKIENNRPTNGNYISNTCCKITINFLYQNFVANYLLLRTYILHHFKLKWNLIQEIFLRLYLCDMFIVSIRENQSFSLISIETIILAFIRSRSCCFQLDVVLLLTNFFEIAMQGNHLTHHRNVVLNLIQMNTLDMVNKLFFNVKNLLADITFVNHGDSILVLIKMVLKRQLYNFIGQLKGFSKLCKNTFL